MPNYYNGLVQTTTATEIDCSKFESISSVSVDADVPSGTALHFAFQADGGKFQTYDTTNKKWEDVTGDVTADNLASVGNTLDEVQAFTTAELATFVGKTVNIAIALTMDTSQFNVPTLRGVKFVGKSPANVLSETVDCGAITLNDEYPVDIINISVSKKETGSGKVTVLASIKDENDTWSDYKEYTTYLGDTPTQAKAIALRAQLDVTDLGVDVAQIQSIEVRSRVDNIATFTEGTSVCTTKTYDFGNVMSRAHLVVKHHVVPDTKITAQIALRNPPTTVKGELLGTGDALQHTVKLANLDKLASHGFTMYFDGVAQASDTYSYSPTDGQVTYNAPKGTTVTVDYIYNWESENWYEMTYDNGYPDKDDATLISEQFDYESTSSDMPTGSVGTVRVTMTQLEGKETDVALGTGTGKPVSYHLDHHAVNNKIKVTPETATWKWKESTDYLTVTAPLGEPVSVTYDWVARPLSLESLVAVFDE